MLAENNAQPPGTDMQSSKYRKAVTRINTNHCSTRLNTINSLYQHHHHQQPIFFSLQDEGFSKRSQVTPVFHWLISHCSWSFPNFITAPNFLLSSPVLPSHWQLASCQQACCQCLEFCIISLSEHLSFSVRFGVRSSCFLANLNDLICV